MKKYLQKLPWIILVLVLSSLVAYGFWPVPVKVEVVKSTQGSLQVTVRDDGITRIREKYVVSAPVSGKLLRIELHEGDAVEQDYTVLARIEPSDPTLLDARTRAEAKARVQAAEAAQQQAEASLQRAEAAGKLAKRHYDRALDLSQTNAISDEEFDEAEHRHRMAQADIRSADFGLNVAKFELELAKAALIRSQPRAQDDETPSLLTITAPVSGKVLRVMEESAGAVTVGAQLLELGNPKDLEMEIDVLSTDAVQIRPGAKVYVEHWGGKTTLEGVVRVVEPSAFLKVSALGVEEQRVNIIADFTDPLQRRETLGDGFRIEARIVIHRVEDAVKVAAGALFRESDKWFVFRVRKGRAQRQHVQIGATNGVETEITSGLHAADAVILHPTDKVRDGVRVQID